MIYEEWLEEFDTCVNQDDSLLDQSFITGVIRIKIKAIGNKSYSDFEELKE